MCGRHDQGRRKRARVCGRYDQERKRECEGEMIKKEKQRREGEPIMEMVEGK